MIFWSGFKTFSVQESDPECYSGRKAGSGNLTLDKSTSLESPAGTRYHSLNRFHSPKTPIRQETLTYDEKARTSKRSLKSYRYPAGTSGEHLLNVTCSLDTDSFFVPPIRDQVETDIDNSIEYGTLIEDHYAASINSPQSCYSSVSWRTGSQRLRLVDKNSGVVFRTVSQGTNGVLSGPDIGLASIMYDLDYVPATSSLGKSSSFPTGLVESLPVIALTVPTPVIPPSPVFVPQSPVTLNKFSVASAKFLDDGASFSSLIPVPLAPECEECFELRRQQQEEFQYEIDDEEGFESQWYCRACHRQWLACQVWYQASDGGRRQYLREPFIRPGEVNANNRAMMEMMGMPASPTFEMDAESESLKGLVVQMRDANDSVGIGRRISKSVKTKLRRSLKKAMGRSSNGDGDDYIGRVDEIGHIQHTSYQPRLDNLFKDSPGGSPRHTFWSSVKTVLGLRRRRS